MDDQEYFAKMYHEAKLFIEIRYRNIKSGIDQLSVTINGIPICCTCHIIQRQLYLIRARLEAIISIRIFL